MALGGWDFTVQPAEINEQPLLSESPQDYVLRLAQEKAQAAACRVPDAEVVIAADTTVVDRGQILGKPEDAAEAAAMLRQLRSRTHQVYTGLAFLRCQDGRLISELCATNVTMRAYTEVEMEVYIQSGDPLDKAGAYAIQHAGFHPVEGVEGCYTNVVGLPLCRVFRQLRALGYPPLLRPKYACLYTDVQGCSFETADG